MDDQRLVQEVLEGKSDAFKELIKRYQRLVAGIVFRYVDDVRDREEIAQDIFIKIHEKLSGFKFQSKLSTWIATIAYRESVSFLRKKKKYREEDLENVVISESDNLFEKEDIRVFLYEMIDRLPDTYGLVLKLYHIEGFSYPEIVEVLDMPEGTVKNYLFRARKKLKDILLIYVEKERLLYD